MEQYQSDRDEAREVSIASQAHTGSPRCDC